MASDDSPASLSFVDLEPIDPAELAPIVVKRFRKSLPLAAASQASGSAAAPPASAQDSPASLRSWSVVVPASTDVARELSFADLQPDASASAPLPGPLDVIARLPVGSRSSFECPVLRDVSDALPRPLLFAPKEPSPTSSSSPLPRPSFAPASRYDKGPAHRLDVALPSAALVPSGSPVAGCGAVPVLPSKQAASFAIRSFAVAGGKSTFSAAASASALPEPSFRTSSGALEKEWLQARGLWSRVVPWLLPLSSFLQELLGKPNCTELLELVWRRNSATTVKRYLQSLFRVFSMLEDLEVPFPSFSQLQLHDAVLALHRTFDGSLTFGDNVLKALRWSQKAFQLDLPSLHSGIFASTALFQRTGEKREATPIPLAFAVWLEFSFLKGIEDMAERMFVGAVLLCLWASLRFGDAQHVRWSSLLFDVNTLRGWCYKTKTHPRGTPFAVTSGGFCGSNPGHDWLALLCLSLNEVLAQCRQCFAAACDPDALFFSFDAGAPSFVPLSYGQALLRLRSLASRWSEEIGLASTQWISGLSLHSLKATFLSYGAQTNQSEQDRAVQGHHKLGSVALYGRDDCLPALRLQRAVVSCFSKGWRAQTPLQRGLLTLQEPPVVLPASDFALRLDLSQVHWLLRFDSGQCLAEDSELSTMPAEVMVTAPPSPSSDAPVVADALPVTSVAPAPGDVSEAESEDLGQPDEVNLISALQGKVLHLNVSGPGCPPRPACGCFAKGWKHVLEPGPAFQFCRHPACNKAVWYD